ncbi:hypothetical protein LJC34_00405 [Oscillospiraceae bacterium OttesenSCG-928-G22]|nr:hypothetical protein [Oscillospiraceae bacterium OttesenSCG-928-G22]
MQNRYACDVGDFGKFGLLRSLSWSGLVVGLNWYLVPDENHNADGKHISYLSDPKFSGCDDTLLNALKSIVGKERSVAAIERLRLISGAEYYSEVLSSPVVRAAWHRDAMQCLRDCDIVFLDPDNGVLVKSVGASSSKSIKYVLREEIADYYASGKSVVFYNHRSREQEQVYLKRFDWLRTEARLSGASLFGLKFARGTIRDYFFIVKPEHCSRVYYAMEGLLSSTWQRHFSKLDIAD